MNKAKQQQVTQFTERRQHLLDVVKRTFPEQQGAIVLWGAFESDRHRFRQDSIFYYLSGVQEPGCALVIALDGSSTLFIPALAGNRAQWVGHASVAADAESAAELGVTQVVYTGKPHTGYSVLPAITAEQYENLITTLQQYETLFVCYPPKPTAHCVLQQQMTDNLQRAAQHSWKIQDCTPLVARMRRNKSHEEIELIYNAVTVTMAAHEAVARSIQDGISEAQLQAGVAYVFAEAGATEAFPSIIASGKNATTLHYDRNGGTLKAGELVLVDIGAERSMYCADVSRTYPVSGTFTERQRELYQLVLDTQAHVAALAKPGMWLCNKEKPKESLHHCAVAFLEQKGYAKYLTHTIGHFLGLDVHDFGDSVEPLCEGDIITIEPGLYLPDENIGIRIEDNYWIVKDGAECLSEALPRSVEDIQAMAQASFDDASEDGCAGECEDGCCSDEDCQ